MHEVPLHQAVLAGDLGAVRVALETCQLWETREALELSIVAGRRDIAGAIVAHGGFIDRAGRRWGRWGGPLHAALLLGSDEAMIETLLAGGVAVEARDRDGRTPLAIAVRTGNRGAEKRLRAAGARREDVDGIDRALGEAVGAVLATRPEGRLLRSDHQHLAWAIRRRRFEAIGPLLELGLDPNVPDDDGETPLHLAVEARSVEAIGMLLGGGADADARSFRDDTPLARAIAIGDPAVVARLAAAGALAVDGSDLADVFVAAADAVVEGDLERLRALLDRHPRLVAARSGAAHRAQLIHYTGANGVERQETPANVATVVALLTARGADPNALAFTYGGGPWQTPLYLAATSSIPDDAGRMTELLEALIRAGAMPDTDDRDAFRSCRASSLPTLFEAGARLDLWLAAALGRTADVRRLANGDGSLAVGAKVGSDARCPDAYVIDRASLVASARGHLDVVAHLVAAGANLDAVEVDERMTALHLAVRGGHLEVARLLITHGAPRDRKSVYGGTALGTLRWMIANRLEPPNAEALLELLA